MAALPSADTQEYLWWSQGAHDEAKARDEKLGPQAREVRDVLEALAERRGKETTATDLIAAVARIYCPDRLRRRYR